MGSTVGSTEWWRVLPANEECLLRILAKIWLQRSGGWNSKPVSKNADQLPSPLNRQNVVNVSLNFNTICDYQVLIGRF